MSHALVKHYLSVWIVPILEMVALFFFKYEDHSDQWFISVAHYLHTETIGLTLSGRQTAVIQFKVIKDSHWGAGMLMHNISYWYDAVTEMYQIISGVCD